MRTFLFVDVKVLYLTITMKQHVWAVVFLLSTLFSCVSDKEPELYIGLSQCSNDEWRQKMDEEMERELLFHPNISLSIRSAADDSRVQSAQIDSFIQEKVDLLIVSPNEADGLTDAVSRAYDAGIPVVVADRRVNGDKYTAFIGGDNYQVGRLLADYVINLQSDNLILLRGLQGSTPDVLRYQGLIDGLSASKKDKTILQEIRADWFEHEAYQHIASLLSSEKKDEVSRSIIIAFNDRMALGARCAFDEQQITPLCIVGVDALSGDEGGVKAVATGKLQASVSYATAGDLIIKTAVAILQDEPFQRDTIIPAILIDQHAAEPMMILNQEINNEMQTIATLQEYIDSYVVLLHQEQVIIGLVLVIAILAVVFLIYYFRLYKQNKLQADELKNQAQKLALQATELRQAHQELEQATLSKLTFFTNVSHDFRTPLALIADPITQLSEDKSLTAEQHTLARLAQKNAQVLLRLINQTLDLRKYESGMLRLNLSQIDMQVALEQWIKAFQPLTYRKHVYLSLEVTPNDNHSDAYLAALDVEKTERIVYNLIANAFKFTPPNGEIKVTLWSDSDNVCFSVSDTGCGISEEHKKHIFESFYQVDTTNRQGSGIGLTLVRSFVLLHGGTIQITDNEHSSGSCFTVSLPKGNLNEVQFVVGEEGYVKITSSQIITELDEPVETIMPHEQAQKEHILLVIDDNTDIRYHLRHIFQKDYTVLTAKNGIEGISKAVQAIPDIIICDISMPDMDGLEVCKHLKNDPMTSHIPVLMLTAHSLDDKRIEGFTSGADAYMLKPFNSEVLKAQVTALRENRKKVRESLSATATMGKPVTIKSAEKQLLSVEEEFLQKFRKIVIDRLDDEQLSVEMIADQMAISRTQLYRKIKQLTNFSPNELVRNTRLEEARRRLAKGGVTIAEVAYSTGFTSPSYFTKCYSEYFGTLPSVETYH